MVYKKRAILALALVLCGGSVFCGADEISTANSYDFSVSDIAPDKSFADEHESYDADMEYLYSVVAPYADKFVVTNEEYIDCSDIDAYFKAISTPLTLDEIDNSSYKTNYDNINISDERKENFRLLKIVGSCGGIKAEFEPIAYYRIYRKTAVIGGYVQYTYEYEDPAVAQWLCCDYLQTITKQLVGNDLRELMLERMTDLMNYTKNDKQMVIAVLQDGKLDSLFDSSVKEDIDSELKKIDTPADLNIDI